MNTKRIIANSDLIRVDRVLAVTNFFENYVLTYVGETVTEFVEISEGNFCVHTSRGYFYPDGSDLLPYTPKALPVIEALRQLVAAIKGPDTRVTDWNVVTAIATAERALAALEQAVAND